MKPTISIWVNSSYMLAWIEFLNNKYKSYPMQLPAKVPSSFIEKGHEYACSTVGWEYKDVHMGTWFSYEIGKSITHELQVQITFQIFHMIKYINNTLTLDKK